MVSVESAMLAVIRLSARQSGRLRVGHRARGGADAQPRHRLCVRSTWLAERV